MESQGLMNAAKALQESELAWVPQFLSEFKGDAEALKKFDSAPEEYIRSRGYDLPDGFHVHYIDENGEYHPREDNLSPGDSGFRLEARVDHGNVALGICIYCPDSCNK